MGLTTEDRLQPRVHLSQKFYERVKLSRTKMRELALGVGLLPTTFSLALNRQRKVALNDRRYIEIGKRVGLTPTEVFDAPNTEQRGAA